MNIDEKQEFYEDDFEESEEDTRIIRIDPKLDSAGWVDKEKTWMIRREKWLTDGDLGVLERKQVEIAEIVHIGKESNTISIDEELDDDSYQIYEDPNELDIEFGKISDKILQLKPKDVKHLGITKPTLWRAQRKIESSEINRISDRIKNLLISHIN